MLRAHTQPCVQAEKLRTCAELVMLNTTRDLLSMQYQGRGQLFVQAIYFYVGQGTYKITQW